MSSTNFIYARPSDEVGHLATISMPTNTEDTQFPAARLCDWDNEQETIPAMAASAGAATWQLTFPGSPANQPIEWIVLWHNFDPGITVNFQGSNDSFGTTPLNVSLVMPAKTLDGFSIKLFVDLTLESGYDPAGFEAYRLVVPSASVPAGAKLLCFSTLRQTTANIKYGYRKPKRSRTINLNTDFAFEWVYRLFSPQHELNATMLPTSNDLEDLKDLYDDAGGHAKVFAFIEDPDVNVALIVRFKADTADGLSTTTIDPTQFIEDTDRHALNLVFTELTAGLPEWT